MKTLKTFTVTGVVIWLRGAWVLTHPEHGNLAISCRLDHRLEHRQAKGVLTVTPNGARRVTSLEWDSGEGEPAVREQAGVLFFESDRWRLSPGWIVVARSIPNRKLEGLRDKVCLAKIRESVFPLVIEIRERTLC